MSKGTVTEGDTAEVVSSEKEPQNQTDDQENAYITLEVEQQIPQITHEETIQESPNVNETIQESVNVDETSHLSVKTAVSETVEDKRKKSLTEISEDPVHQQLTEAVQEPTQHAITEAIQEPEQLSVVESVQETVTKEDKLGDAHTSDLAEEQNIDHVQQEIVSPDAEQGASKLDTSGERPQSSQVTVTFEKKDGEGISEEGISVDTEKIIEPEGRKSLIPDIDEIRPPTPRQTREDTIIEHITFLEPEVSQVSLHVEDLPEIRGLAELEYLERKESIALSVLQEDWMDEDFLPSRRKSTRPSIALRKLIEEEDEEPTEKGKGKASKAEYKASIGIFPEMDEVEEQRKIFSREEYYKLYEKLTSEFPMIKMKNKFLQRKMGELLKKRKVEHALKEESKIQMDVMEKYKHQLNKLAHLLKAYSAITIKISNELDSLQKEKEIKYNESQVLFNKLINREKEIGFGLISTKTGKEIPQKVVEQLIRRQMSATHETSVLRLKYITKRDELAEKTAELKSLDNIGDDLSLMDYEQLKIENRSLADKLEEKEEELTKLRVKCRNAVQVMAHIREKAAALDADMDVLKEDFEEVNYEYIEMRERLNFYKTERDEVRNKTMKLKAESGLLTKPKLLIDMEASMEEAKVLEKTLEHVKNEYNKKTQQIRTLRKNIVYEMMMNRKPPKKKKKAGPKFFNARPTLILPKIPSNVIEKLQNMVKESSKSERVKKKP